MHPPNERRRYIVTSSLIGWAHTQNDPQWLFCACTPIQWETTSHCNVVSHWLTHTQMIHFGVLECGPDSVDRVRILIAICTAMLCQRKVAEEIYPVPWITGIQIIHNTCRNILSGQLIGEQYKKIKLKRTTYIKTQERKPQTAPCNFHLSFNKIIPSCLL